jgi:predicted RNA polymerase sigma factor
MTRGVDRRPLVDVLIFERAAPTGARLHPPRPTRSVQLQAAIQAVHCAADTFQASDWPQIVALYDQLFSVMPTPVVALNRAIAVVEIEGPAAALTTLDAIAPDLGTYHLMHAARGTMLRRLGHRNAAQAAFERAAHLAATEKDRRFSPNRSRSWPMRRRSCSRRANRLDQRRKRACADRSCNSPADAELTEWRR